METVVWCKTLSSLGHLWWSEFLEYDMQLIVWSSTIQALGLRTATYGALRLQTSCSKVKTLSCSASFCTESVPQFGVTLFFTVLNTITVALRIFARTKLSKGAFGWDDIMLLITYVGFILYATFMFETIHYGYVSTDSKPWYSTAKGILYNNGMNDICYIISATVKISVALVLYRLVERVYSTVRWVLIIDIVACAIFNAATTLILALGCMPGTPYTFSNSVCENTNYAQESSYVIWDMFHVVLPVFILWNIQMGWMIKIGVVGLFSVGLLAAITTILRLRNYVEYFNPTSTTTLPHIWYTGVTWATTEHGLSLFAASILALKPVVQVVSRSWSSLSSSLNSSGRKKVSGSGESDRVLKNSDWTFTPDGTELGNIGVRTEISVDAKYKGQGRLQAPTYSAAAYNGSHDSHQSLVEGLTTRTGSKSLV